MGPARMSMTHCIFRTMAVVLVMRGLRDLPVPLTGVHTNVKVIAQLTELVSTRLAFVTQSGSASTATKNLFRRILCARSTAQITDLASTGLVRVTEAGKVSTALNRLHVHRPAVATERACSVIVVAILNGREKIAVTCPTVLVTCLILESIVLDMEYA
jgi:hypothetical protein